MPPDVRHVVATKCRSTVEHTRHTHLCCVVIYAAFAYSVDTRGVTMMMAMAMLMLA